MSKRDYYEVLGVEKNASDSEMKRAYRNLARKFHPDVNKDDGAEDTFKQISEAYDVLSDSQRRAAYDRFGHEGLGGGGGFGGGSYQDFSGFGGLGDIFEAFFGGSRDPFQGQRGGQGGAGSRAERGSDLRMDIMVSFRDAIFGVEHQIEIEHLEACDTCEGEGKAPGTEMTTCSTCRGSGQIQQHQRTAFGTFAHVAACPKCQGQGKFAEHPCKSCNGQGRKKKKKKLKVPIPPGVDSGVRLCLNGEGDAGLQGGPAGDLYLVLRVKEDADGIFERRDQNIYTEVSVGYAQATLGDKIEVPTLEGNTRFDLPAGTQPGSTFKLKGKGVPLLNSSATRGDLYFKVNVAVPTRVNGEQRELLESLYALETGTGTSFSYTEEGGMDTEEKSEKKGGFFDVLKETWKSHHKES